MKWNFRVTATNNWAGLRRILVHLQGVSAGAYQDSADGCNAVDGPKNKQGGAIIFCRGPYWNAILIGCNFIGMTLWKWVKSWSIVNIGIPCLTETAHNRKSVFDPWIPFSLAVL